MLFGGVEDVAGTDDGEIEENVGPTTVNELGALSIVASDASTTVTCPRTVPVAPSCGLVTVT